MNNKDAFIDDLPITTSNFSRVSALCLVILLICIIVFLIGYAVGNHDIQVASFGGVIASGLILVVVNPIETE